MLLNEKFFPVLIITLSLCASFVYFVKGDIRHGLYWLFAAALPATVTF